MNFKKWVKSIQTAGYNGARTVNDYLQGMIEGSIEVEDGSGLKYEYKVVKLESEEMIPEEEAMIEQESTGYF